MSSSGSLQLSYAFVPDPNPIRASVGDANPNTVSLQIIISNPNAPDVVTLQGIIIQIPVGGEIGGDLSAAKDLPNPVPATSGAWNITASGSTVSILPQSGQGTTATLADTLTLTLPHITVNKEIGTVQVAITEIDQDGNSTADTSHTLVKLASDFPVTSFQATPDILNNLEQTVTLKWTCSDQGKNYVYRVYSVDPESRKQPGPKSWMPKECLKNGDCYTCASGSHGVTTTPQVPAPDTMTITFCLDVVEAESGGSRKAVKTLSTTVRVEVPSISGNSYQTLYLSGRIVVLHWLAFNAAKCTVELDGQVIDDNAPVDTYLQGYPVYLLDKQGQHQLTVTAHAESGPAKYVFPFPVIDISALHTIPIGLDPNGIAITPDGRLALVVIAGDNNVKVIDMATRTVEAATIPTGIFPSRIAITPDGHSAVVTNWSVNTVTVIDITRRAGDTIFSNTKMPTPIAITPDSRLAVVGGVADPNMVVIDIATRTVEPRTIPVGAYPGGIAITPDGRSAFVTIPKNNTVTVIDIARRTAGPTPIQVSQSPGVIAITPDGQLALVTTGSNMVTVIDIATRAAESHAIPVGQNPQAIAITPDGAFALVVCNGSAELKVIDIAGRKAAPAAIPLGQSPLSIAITPDATRAVVTNYDDNTVMVI